MKIPFTRYCISMEPYEWAMVGGVALFLAALIGFWISIIYMNPWFILFFVFLMFTGGIVAGFNDHA